MRVPFPTRTAPALVLLLALGIAPWSTPARADERAPFAARDGLALAADAARAWADDAQLVYVENDEDLGAAGQAPRWGYLFRSTQRGRCRSYSLSFDGGAAKVLQARDLDFDFDAPPLPTQWVDSAAALLSADDAGGRDYCRKHQGRLSSMVLLRGAFHPQRPDMSTWTVVYTSPDAPSFYVLLDASSGHAVRTWRG
ncbi:hypothetical protein KDL67_15710 [bacterium]|nr:hypothetical protein [bacterium]